MVTWIYYLECDATGVRSPDLDVEVNFRIWGVVCLLRRHFRSTLHKLFAGRHFRCFGVWQRTTFTNRLPTQCNATVHTGRMIYCARALRIRCCRPASRRPPKRRLAEGVRTSGALLHIRVFPQQKRTVLPRLLNKNTAYRVQTTDII